MSAAAASIRARQKAESLMTSTCTVFSAGSPVTDQNTGVVTRPTTTLYTGPCRVRPAVTGLTALSEAIGGAETFRFDYRVSIPFNVTAVLEGHRLTITSSPDPVLVGTTMEVHRVDRGDNITARRLICQRIG